MKSNHKKILLEIICMLFVLLFVYAAVSKLLEYNDFTIQLEKSPVLSDVADLVSWFIPFIEIVIALLLIIPQFRLLGLYVSFTLMVLFTSYILIILNFADHVPCSCGGILESLGWTEHIYFNLFFILAAVTGIIISSYQQEKQFLFSQ